jgi:glycosyltransferase involved in cell wall biosynthesis
LLERWVDAFIAPSEFVRRILALAGIHDERVHVIPHGVPRIEAASTPGKFALFAGRLTSEKGLRTLLEAARAAPDVPLRIAGDGPLEPEVRAANVEYVGKLSRHEMAETLREAAFVVVPSESHEVFPYSVLESLAAGKPVVATSVGGMPEIVADRITGLLVPPRSAPELAHAMRTLWRDRRMADELGARASEVARERFSLDRQVTDTVALYESLLDGRPRSL